MKVYIGKYPKDHNQERKVEVRIDKQDLWGLDHTLAQIIHPALAKLKESKQGAPHVEDADVPEELRRPADYIDSMSDTDDNWFKRWDWVLDEMIFAFGCIKNDEWEDQFHTGEHDIVWQPVDKEGNPIADESAERVLLVFGPNNTHKFDREGYDAMYKRIENGTRLFGVYYSGLWN
jgi:hypothetical protein